MDAVKDLERCFGIAACGHAVRHKSRGSREAQSYDQALHGVVFGPNRIAELTQWPAAGESACKIKREIGQGW